MTQLDRKGVSVSATHYPRYATTSTGTLKVHYESYCFHCLTESQHIGALHVIDACDLRQSQGDPLRQRRALRGRSRWLEP